MRVSDDAKLMTVTDAVREHVHAGDALHLVVGHSRWSAAAREVVRQWWDRDPGFTLVMLSLSSLGALFFRGGLVERVVTGYSGDTFPNFTPNPWFQRGYTSGAVAVEHWSFLAFAQRLEAGAAGLPAVVTRSIADSSMADNDGFAVVDSPYGPVGLLAPLRADVAILHAPVADRRGNVAVAPPLLEGVWGALGRAARCHRHRGPGRRRPARALDVRADPRPPRARGLRGPDGRPPGRPVRPGPAGRRVRRGLRLLDRGPCRRPAGDDYDDWIRHWILEPDDQPDYLDRLGADRVASLRAKADPAVHARAAAAAAPTSMRHRTRGSTLRPTRPATSPDGSSRSARTRCSPVPGSPTSRRGWACRPPAAQGHDVQLTAEIGMWGYEPMLGDPFVLNHGSFPTATMLGDAAMVLGALVGGPGTTTIGCLGGAQVDRAGNINSTLIPGGPFLVGSGGGNDVASVATENVVVATLTPQRTPPECGYVTSPGRTVQALVTDLGTLEAARAELVLDGRPGR